MRRGAERLVHDLARGFARRGHTPTVIASASTPGTGSDDGFRVILTRRLPERPLRWAGYHEYAGHLPFTYRTLCQGGFDVANAFYVSDAVAAVRWSERTGRPAVFTVTGIPREDVTRGRRLRLRAWETAVSGSGAVIALSHDAAQRLRWLGAQAQVIHPGVDLELFEPAMDRAAAPTVFCPAAIDDRRKRVALLVQAMGSLRSRIPELRLVLSAPRAADVPEWIQREREWIELRHVDDDAALVAAYSAAWVTVLASRLEAFGLVLVESLACGTPVVGTREGGIPEIIDPEVGRLFTADDVGDLTRAIAAVLETAGEARVREACRARAAAFSLQRCIDGYAELYDGLS